MKAGFNGISAEVSRACDFLGMRTCSSCPGNGISRPPGTAPLLPLLVNVPGQHSQRMIRNSTDKRRCRTAPGGDKPGCIIRLPFDGGGDGMTVEADGGRGVTQLKRPSRRCRRYPSLDDRYHAMRPQYRQNGCGHSQP